jgi:hypothetical protein
VDLLCGQFRIELKVGFAYSSRLAFLGVLGQGCGRKAGLELGALAEAAEVVVVGGRTTDGLVIKGKDIESQLLFRQVLD